MELCCEHLITILNSVTLFNLNSKAVLSYYCLAWGPQLTLHSGAWVEYGVHSHWNRGTSSLEADKQSGILEVFNILPPLTWTYLSCTNYWHIVYDLLDVIMYMSS